MGAVCRDLEGNSGSRLLVPSTHNHATYHSPLACPPSSSLTTAVNLYACDDCDKRGTDGWPGVRAMRWLNVLFRGSCGDDGRLSGGSGILDGVISCSSWCWWRFWSVFQGLIPVCYFKMGGDAIEACARAVHSWRM